MVKSTACTPTWIILLKLGARYYDPTLARFTQTDPSGQEANAYSYAADNPVGNIDPTGQLSFMEDVIIGVGAVVLVAGMILAGPELVAVGGLAATALNTTVVMGGLFDFTAGTACMISKKC